MVEVTIESQVNLSLALQLLLNSGLCIFACHIKLRRLWAQGRVNLVLESDTSQSSVLPLLHVARSLSPPYSIPLPMVQTLMKYCSGEKGSEQHLGRGQGLICVTPTKKVG